MRPRTILVTGAGGGIGSELVVLLLADGARVAAVDISRDALDRLASACADAGDCLVTLQSDLVGLAECRRVVDAAGQVIGLAHLAGLFEPDVQGAVDEALWDRAISHNLKNAYDIADAVAGQLPDDPMGRMLFTASIAYRRGSHDHVPYSAAKGGIVGLTRALSRKLARTATVNALAPGVIDTPMPAHIIEKRLDRMLQDIPLRRLGHPREVATVARFLLSDDASYISGQVINVDGGMINS